MARVARKSAGITPRDVVSRITSDRYDGVYLIVGEERLLADELQRIIIDRAVPPSVRAFDLEILSGPELTGADVVARSRAFPMMSPRRLVVVRDAERVKDAQAMAPLAQVVDASAASVVLIATKVNKAHHPWKQLCSDGAVWVDVARLRPAEVIRWVLDEAKRTKLVLHEDVAHALVDLVGTDLQRLRSELEKLKTFVGGGEARVEISKDDLAEAVGQSRDINVFELQSALVGGRFGQVHHITERLLQQGSSSTSEAIMIVSFLSSYFRKLWRLSICQGSMPPKEAAAFAGVPSFVVAEYLSTLRTWGTAAIEACTSALLKADLALKGGSQADPQTILTLMNQSIARVAPTGQTVHA